MMGLALATTVRSQTSWVVTASNPANLQDAIDLANPGDELLVQPGTYPAIWLTKGLTIRAQQPGTVILLGSVLFQAVVIPPGQHAHFVGLESADMWIFGEGTTTLEDCHLADGGIVLSVAFGNVHLERCVVEAQGFPLGAQACVSISGALVTAVDTVIRGAIGSVGSAATPAIALADATLIGTGLELLGGAGSSNASGIVADGGSSIRLSDSVVSGGAGTCAITGGDAECVRCTLSATCSVSSGSMLGMWADSAVTTGQPYTLNFRGEPNTFVLVFGSNQPDEFASADLKLPFLLSAPGCFAAAALLTDGTGQANVTWQIPSAPLPPAVGIWFQGVSGTSLPLDTSTLVGGMVR